nr:receptor-like protein kinase INRPK1c [Ipomoea nil]
MLEELDVSHNNLSGTLRVLSTIQSLTFINISHNLFSGPVPPSLTKFLNSSPTSFSGNSDLCINCPADGLACPESSILRPCNMQSNTGKGGLSTLGIAMIVLGALLFIICLFLFSAFLFLHCKKSVQEIAISAQEGDGSLLNKVLEATENLNDKYVIGKGAHGTIYKATLSPDKVYAVKKLVFTGIKNGSVSMVREIETIGKVRHRNLIKLEEFWLRKEYGLILYTYMENGSLHDILHETNPPKPLDWSTRHNIAVGTAHGLAYLHFDCDPAIVHRDIKPMNILLDSDLEPHISDFGIAKLLDQSATSIPSNTVQGTIGYMAPENAFTTVKSRESDVYSYGVVLLELITRKKALDPSFNGETDIVGWVRSVWTQTGEIQKIVDPSLLDELIDSSVMEQVTEALSLALRCAEKEVDKRPTMRDVVKQLTRWSIRSYSSSVRNKSK